MTDPSAFLVTGDIDPATDRDTGRLAAALRRRGVPTQLARWSDPTVRWSDAGIAVVRSTWDYGRDPPAFRSWIELCGQQTMLLNSPSLLSWNLHKRYLVELAAADLPVVPTRLVEDPQGARVEAIMKEEGWSSIVMKPMTGNDGQGVQRLESGVEVATKRGVRGSEEPFVVQPYLPSVETVGEVSLILIDGELSHVVTKTPGPGEFRTQERLGGRVGRRDPADEHHRIVKQVLAYLQQVPLYVRIDLLEIAGRAVISELELVEPDLYLRLEPGSYDRLARAIVRRLGGADSSNQVESSQKVNVRQRRVR